MHIKKYFGETALYAAFARTPLYAELFLLVGRRGNFLKSLPGSFPAGKTSKDYYA